MEFLQELYPVLQQQQQQQMQAYSASLATGIVLYALHAIALYALANRCMLKNAWIAWVPIFGASYVAGSIADELNGQNNKNTHYRYIALGTAIFNSLCSFAILVLIFMMIFSGKLNIFILLLLLLTSASSIVFSIFHVLWTNRIYTHFAPAYANVFTIISVLSYNAEILVLFITYLSDKKKYKSSLQKSGDGANL